MPVVEWVQQCKSCKGTGIYVGLAERDGAGVVCLTCDGTGRKEMRFEYEDFTGKQRRNGVTQVYKSSAGYVINPQVAQGGVPYEEWLENPESVNGRGTEIRNLACPLLWSQTAGARRPDWEECRGIWGLHISKCQHYPNKDKCWLRFDMEDGRPGY